MTLDARLFVAGMQATEVVLALLRLRDDIDTVCFSAYRPAPDLNERLVAEPELRRGAGRTFWMLGVRDALRAMHHALVHDKSGEREVPLRRDELTAGRMDALIAGLDPGFVLALNSLVTRANGSVAHIPMIDFRCAPSDEFLTIVRHALGQVGQKRGVLLNSGRSFHFYGLELLDTDDWRGFLGRCLLLAPLVDVRYVAHRLIDGYCRLRISASEKKPTIPVVVGVL